MFILLVMTCSFSWAVFSDEHSLAGYSEKRMANMLEKSFISKVIKAEVAETEEGRKLLRELFGNIKRRLKFKVNCRLIHSIIKQNNTKKENNRYISSSVFSTSDYSQTSTKGLREFCVDQCIAILQRGNLIGNDAGEEPLPLDFVDEEI